MSHRREDREDHDVPARLRREVIDRDGSCCRVCGRFVEYPALHHVYFRSQGGRPDLGEGEPKLHVARNLVVIGWLPGHDCHLPIAHGPAADAVRALLVELVDDETLTGVTAMALARWRGQPLPVGPRRRT